jgi:catechol O-methyltransferase
MQEARPVRLLFLPPDGHPRLINFKSVEDLALSLQKHIFTQPQERFLNQPWELVKAIEAFAQNKRMMIFKENKLTLARQQLQGLQPPPKTIIEFGTYVGNSAIAWGAILRDLHAENVHDCNVYTFELSPVSAQVARDLVRLAGLEDLVRVLEGPAAESLKKLHIEGKVKAGAVDMAFFDHWEKFYLPDLQLCEDLKLFHKGSLAIADNTDIPGAPDYLAYVKAGGRGGKGTVRYDSQSLEAVAEEGHPVRL